MIRFGNFLEQAPPEKEVEKPDPKQKRLNMIKRQVLMKKVQAVRQGGAEDITASHEPEGKLVEGDVHSGQGEKIQKRTKAWMDKKGQKGAPGLDAMKARTAEHKAKRGVKEEVVDESIGDQVRKGLKRHKDAVEKKKIKNRKAVPYAALAAEHQPEGEMVEHHQKDKDGKVIEHEDTAPCSVEEELSRRSKPSAKAKMAKLDAVLKRREDKKIAEKQALKNEGWLGKKKEEKKPQKAMDAGARAKRKLQRKEYAAKVSGSEDNVPDEMREGVGRALGGAARAVGGAAKKTVGYAAKAAGGIVGQAHASYNDSTGKHKPKIDLSKSKKKPTTGGLSAAQSQAETAKKARLDARKKAIQKIKDDRRERATTIMTAEKAAKKVKKEGEDKKFKADSGKPIVAEFVDHLWEAKKCPKCGKKPHKGACKPC
jgi:hypothetical protein